jgi:hypothetical protein
MPLKEIETMSKILARRMFLATFVVAIATCVSAVQAQQPAPAQEVVYTAILKVPNMCCGKEGGPAVAELSKLPGVVKVVPDYKNRRLIISPASNHAVSHRALWEAAERAKVPPTELATIAGVYKSKPQR